MKRVTLAAALMLVSGVALTGQVPYQRLVDAAKEPGAWLTYSGGYSGQRHSTLNQITSANVAGLRPTWIYQVAGQGQMETSAIVADGMMYVTEPPTTVTALDPQSGRPIWSYVRPMPSNLRLIGFPATNRGVAILDDMVYVGSLDGALIALDAQTGAVRWETKVATNETGHSITMAPLAVKGKVIVGISGGEAGIRGFVDAYDAKTGKLAWRTHTVPAKGEPGVETWAGDSWKTGAGATWLTGSFDPELNLLYWGTGNPGPDWNGDVRLGDNLYTSSVLALDADTGKMKWHFQYTPHDVHDILLRAREAKISLRTGCFCNPGDGEVAHGIPRDLMASCFLPGAEPPSFEECAERIRATTGRTPNTVRVSLGLASNFSDVYAFIGFVQQFRCEGARTPAPAGSADAAGL